jgi:GNAT superfamily N-acetyltransferase
MLSPSLLAHPLRPGTLEDVAAIAHVKIVVIQADGEAELDALHVLPQWRGRGWPAPWAPHAIEEAVYRWTDLGDLLACAEARGESPQPIR